jgi:hypothetical protein
LKEKRAVLIFSTQSGNEGDDLLAGRSVRSPTFQSDFSYTLPRVRAKLDDVQPTTDNRDFLAMKGAVRVEHDGHLLLLDQKAGSQLEAGMAGDAGRSVINRQS